MELGLWDIPDQLATSDDLANGSTPLHPGTAAFATSSLNFQWPL